MTFPIETYNAIVQTHAAANGKPLATQTPAVLVPDQFEVKSLEHLQSLRARFRGHLSTESFSDFCQYVQRHGDNEEIPPKAFINAETMSCTTFFNLGDQTEPGHGDDRALLRLKPTAAFKAMQQIAGKSLKQSELAEWMEDWHLNLKVEDSEGKSIPTAAAVQKIRTITIKAQAERTSTETNFGNQRSAMDSIEAAHAEQQPADLLFTITPYEGLSERTFTLRLSILTTEPPTIKPRWVMQEQQEEEIAQEFKTKLSAEIGGFATLTVGTFELGK